MTDVLSLKWGTLKGWNFDGNERAIELLEEYFKLGASMGAADQRDSDRQKEIICELIDVGNFNQGVYLEWDGKYASKEQAKEYVMSYGKDL